MQELDIPALAERISEHRFVGSTNNMLADEIDRFRAGAGTAGISDAVDALQEVAQALGETEQTLRTELGKLGVEWQGEAGIMAGSVVQNLAAFSDRAVELLKHMARQVFTQGEAFDRTLHKLPDSQTLRDAPDEYSAADSFLGFFGHETDHAAEVDRVRDARDQALEALDEYAQDSGDNLRAIPTLEAPPEIRADTGAPPADSGEPRAGGGDDVTDTSNWYSAPGTATGSPTAPGAEGEPTGSGHSVGTGTTGKSAAVPASSLVHPGGAGGAETGSGSRSSGGTEGTGAVSGGSDPRHPATSPAPRTAPGDGSAGSAGTASRTGGTTAGSPLSGGEGGGGQGSSSAWQQRPGSHGGGSQSLSSGPLSGAAPTKPAPPVTGESGTGPPDVSSRGASSRADAGGAAAVAGAGGVAGALSNEGERRGRGVGRNAPGASRSPRSLALGDLPEEEARVERQSERLGARSGRARDAFLTPAAARDEDEDDSVRRFGVDDQDLFADQRQVSPDVIGEDVQE